MRIRTIKPEFWRSDDIASLSWDARLVFVGLWSYVDDNGVGRDSLPSIVGDLFAADMTADLYGESTETLRRVSLALGDLAERGLIVRYEVEGKAYLQVTGWTKHQVIKNPSKGHLYPVFSRETSSPPRSLPRVYGDSTETLGTGTGEQGNRGTGEQGNSSLRSDEESHPPSGDSATTDAEADRDDVNRVCEHMANSVHQRTGRRPNITRAWRTAARLMLDRDQRTEADIIAAINWSANDDFWRANILSLPALRRQYDRLSLQAARGRPRPSPLEITQPTTDAENAALVADIFTPSTLKSILAEEAS